MRRAADDAASHAVLLREQIGRTDFAGASLQPALLCLLAAEALGAEADAGLPAATALGLLAAMGDVFDDIATDDSHGLAAAWGMPRAINAGDAFYAAAQKALLSADSTGKRRALAMLDEASRGFSEELNDRLGKGGPSGHRLYRASMALAGIAAGVDDAAQERLADFGKALSISVHNAAALVELDESARSRINAAAGYILGREAQ